MKIAVGCDHAGFHLKEAVKKRLEELGHQVDDKGAYSTDSIDYPDYAAKVAADVASGKAPFGVLVCGSGIGMSISANRFKGVRAVLAPTVEHARLGRLHNNGNLLCMGERLTEEPLAMEILGTFLNTGFEGGRHQRRIDKMDALGGE